MCDNGKFEFFSEGVLERYRGSDKKVALPDGIREIEAYAFWNLDALEEISLPDSIVRIDAQNFSSCKNLKYNEAGGAKYLGNDRNPYLVLVSSDGDIRECDVAEGCKLIMENAFDERLKLSRVSLPDSLRYIGFMAFYSCESLAEVSFSDGLEEVAPVAFSGCPIEKLCLPDSVKRVGFDAFGNVALREAVLSDALEYVGNGAFTHNDIKFNEYNGGLYLGSRKNPYLCFVKPKDRELCRLDIHKDCRIIYSDAFMRCASLESIRLPAGVVQIGENAFRECDSLESVELPSSLSMIEECAFADCVKLKYITLPAGYLEIDGGAFLDCVSLESVDLVCAEVGDNAFSGCEGLLRVTVGEGSNLYGDYIFAACSALREVTLPKKLKGRFTEEEFEDSENAEIKYV